MLTCRFVENADLPLRVEKVSTAAMPSNQMVSGWRNASLKAKRSQSTSVM